MNKTFVGLKLSQRLVQSPFFSCKHLSSLKLFDSSFSRFVSPIIYGSPRKELKVKNFFATKSLSTIINLESADGITFPDDSETTTTLADKNYSAGQYITLVPDGTETLELKNIRFQDCTTSASLITDGTTGLTTTGKARKLSMTDITVTNCYTSSTESQYAFAFKYLSAISINNLHFSCAQKTTANYLGVININPELVPSTIANFTLTDSLIQYYSLESSGDMCNIQGITNLAISFTTFKIANQSTDNLALKLDTVTLGLLYTNGFIGFTKSPVTVSQSLIVDSNSCYPSGLTPTPGSVISYMYTIGVCPIDPHKFGITPEQELTSAEKRDSIITLCVFIVFFVALFVCLIAFIFCKKGGTEKVQYGEINQNSDYDMDEEEEFGATLAESGANEVPAAIENEPEPEPEPKPKPKPIGRPFSPPLTKPRETKVNFAMPPSKEQSPKEQESVQSPPTHDVPEIPMPKEEYPTPKQDDDDSSSAPSSSTSSQKR